MEAIQVRYTPLKNTSGELLNINYRLTKREIKPRLNYFDRNFRQRFSSFFLFSFLLEIYWRVPGIAANGTCILHQWHATDDARGKWKHIHTFVCLRLIGFFMMAVTFRDACNIMIHQNCGFLLRVHSSLSLTVAFEHMQICAHFLSLYYNIDCTSPNWKKCGFNRNLIMKLSNQHSSETARLLDQEPIVDINWQSRSLYWY